MYERKKMREFTSSDHPHSDSEQLHCDIWPFYSFSQPLMWHFYLWFSFSQLMKNVNLLHCDIPSYLVFSSFWMYIVVTFIIHELTISPINTIYPFSQRILMCYTNIIYHWNEGN
jgi:hypothetical protein